MRHLLLALTIGGCCFGAGGPSVEPVPTSPGYGAIRLRVTDEGGLPVRTGRLFIHAVIDDEDVYSQRDLSGDLSDWPIPDVPPGRYMLSFRGTHHGGAYASPYDSFVVEEGATSLAEIHTHGGIELVGSVTDSLTSAPLADAELHAAPEYVGGNATGVVFARTDPDGTFALPGICGTRTSVLVSYPDHITRTVALEPWPLCDVMTVMTRDVRLEPAARTWLEIDPAFVVTRITPGSPADTFGLRVGDHVIAAAGHGYSTDGTLVDPTTQSSSSLVVLFDIRDEAMALRVVGTDGATRELRGTLTRP